MLKFLANIKRIHFSTKGNLNVTDSDLERLLLSPDQAKRLVLDNPELVAALARTEIKSEDIVALGYRREQLSHFKKLLHDNSFFQEALAKTSHRKPEGLWQDFFEANPWIFGISLSLIHFGPLDGKKLQQTVSGASLTTSGKVVDALLRSRAEVSTACFVELKRHDTALLAKEPYRSGCWSPSSELSGAVAQIQGTVSSALRDWAGKMQVKKQNGEPTGEFVFATEPRSFVICGSLSQFCSDNGVNDQQFNAFEMYRRNLIKPEIITFDELYERAHLIVDGLSE